MIALRNARIPTTFEPIREAVLDKSLDGSVRFYGLNALKNIGTKMPHRSKVEQSFKYMLSTFFSIKHLNSE